ncbi:MAG: mevalonate kinase [Legionella sp.]
MKWSVPAKTFLIGEYLAIEGGPAILITTSPCFKLIKTHNPGLHGIHPNSPAGRWWFDHGLTNIGFEWFDPYQGQGGLGASSAQFIAVYKAVVSLKGQLYNQQQMLEDYLNYAWQGSGFRPSGYDVLAQSGYGCVYLNRRHSIAESKSWPFSDLAFILLHTGKKLATHEHLQSLSMPSCLNEFNKVAQYAQDAFYHSKSDQFISAVNQYHELLAHDGLVATHTRDLVALLNRQDGVLAAKGCGAMGADTILLITHKQERDLLVVKLKDSIKHIIATDQNVFNG